MQRVSTWGSSDRRVLVLIATDVLAIFDKYRQRTDSSTEAGGVLLGLRRGSHFEIVAATEPLSTDRRHRIHFQRFAEGHQATAMSLWTASKGTIGHVGEWHTHPEPAPTPSWIDRREWRIVASRPRSMTAVVAVIVGTLDSYVAVVHADGTERRLDEVQEYLPGDEYVIGGT